ncbi:MAG: polysaccharide deacetylase family protein [Solirubrobacterales bacterium]|nr:polysaccharide deacetylase family protein [Solirubrobacterales bacterium]
MYEWHPGRARRWRRFPGLERIAPGGRAVLTFDDGPDPEATPAVLNALDLADVHATFFVLGSRLVAHPELAHEVVARGHEIGLHGYDHHRHDRIASALSRSDLARGFAAIEDFLGIRCRWYRPPYGKMSTASADVCRELGMTPVYWSAWGLDWEDVGAERIAQVVSEQLDDGGIVLLHDSARFARRPSAHPTAQAIPAIVRRAQEASLSLVALRDVAGVRQEVVV